jgi:hypothetical protein
MFFRVRAILECLSAAFCKCHFDCNKLFENISRRLPSHALL